MIRFKLILIAAAACAATLVIASTGVRADNDIDCKPLHRWNSDKNYKKGDVVWIRDGGMNDGSAHRCAKDVCRGAGDNQPYLGHNGTWEKLGGCKSGTRPE